PGRFWLAELVARRPRQVGDGGDPAGLGAPGRGILGGYGRTGPHHRGGGCPSLPEPAASLRERRAVGGADGLSGAAALLVPGGDRPPDRGGTNSRAPSHQAGARIPGAGRRMTAV